MASLSTTYPCPYEHSDEAFTRPDCESPWFKLSISAISYGLIECISSWIKLSAFTTGRLLVQVGMLRKVKMNAVISALACQHDSTELRIEITRPFSISRQSRVNERDTTQELNQSRGTVPLNLAPLFGALRRI